MILLGFIWPLILLIPFAIYSRFFQDRPTSPPIDRAQREYNKKLLEKLKNGDTYVLERTEKKLDALPVSNNIDNEIDDHIEYSTYNYIDNGVEYIINIASDPTDTTWFVCARADLPEPSAAEYRIINELEKHNVEWAREVSFNGLQFTSYGHPRVDFFLPSYRIVLEYNGAEYHNDVETKKTDRSKEKFCKDNGIRVIKYTTKHYYHLHTHIERLMTELGVKRKTPVM